METDGPMLTLQSFGQLLRQQVACFIQERKSGSRYKIGRGREQYARLSLSPNLLFRTYPSFVSDRSLQESRPLEKRRLSASHRIAWKTRHSHSSTNKTMLHVMSAVRLQQALPSRKKGSAKDVPGYQATCKGGLISAHLRRNHSHRNLSRRKAAELQFDIRAIFRESQLKSWCKY